MHDDNRDQFLDQLLEASLKQYRGEEPRPGLETRILAGIRTRERAAWRIWLGWAVAVSTGILAIVALALHFARAPVRQPTPSASLPQSPMSGSADPRFWGPRLVHRPKEKPRTPNPGVRATKPARPEQFPTPLPLTEQEKLLFAYLGKTPKPDLAAGTDETDEATVTELAIPGIKIAALEIKPLDDSQSEQGK